MCIRFICNQDATLRGMGTHTPRFPMMVLLIHCIVEAFFLNTL